MHHEFLLLDNALILARIKIMKFINSYYALPQQFYTDFKPSLFKKPELVSFNESLAMDLDFDFSSLSREDLAMIFTGEKTLDGSVLKALAYAGHQFGHFVPSLGDGRAALMGEVESASGKTFDLQLKGSGPTAFSRRGDGYSALGPALREYLVSESMFQLGIPTTRSLAVVATGEVVYRETALAGGILTRVASSHLRIGTFQYFAARRDPEALETLLNYSVKRHYPEHAHLSLDEKALAFLSSVAKKQVELISQWMGVGFIHGVMNTDNMAISGETLDFGPCAFMDHFNYHQVFSFIDKNGRYAYSQQPHILLWNLSRLADCLVPLLGANESVAVEKLNAVLSSIPKIIEQEMRKVFSRKLGLEGKESECEDVISQWINYLEETHVDFTLAHFYLEDLLMESPSKDAVAFFPQTPSGKNFFEAWKKLSPVIKPDLNPLYIPRNHLVEEAIGKAYQGDFSLFHRLNKCWQKPFHDGGDVEWDLARAPLEQEKIKNTFCGT